MHGHGVARCGFSELKSGKEGWRALEGGCEYGFGERPNAGSGEPRALCGVVGNCPGDGESSQKYRKRGAGVRCSSNHKRQQDGEAEEADRAGDAGHEQRMPIGNAEREQAEACLCSSSQISFGLAHSIILRQSKERSTPDLGRQIVSEGLAVVLSHPRAVKPREDGAAK